jgi:hypothetical protein
VETPPPPLPPQPLGMMVQWMDEDKDWELERVLKYKGNEVQDKATKVSVFTRSRNFG